MTTLAAVTTSPPPRAVRILRAALYCGLVGWSGIASFALQLLVVPLLDTVRHPAGGVLGAEDADGLWPILGLWLGGLATLFGALCLGAVFGLAQRREYAFGLSLVAWLLPAAVLTLAFGTGSGYVLLVFGLFGAVGAGLTLWPLLTRAIDRA